MTNFPIGAGPGSSACIPTTGRACWPRSMTTFAIGCPTTSNTVSKPKAARTAGSAAAGVPVGVATCWEVIFDRAPREAVRNGAQLLTVPANNATFNQAMSEQQLAFGKLRAVEHDRYLVVAGTTGISAIVAPDGRELARTEFFEPAYLDSPVRLKTQLTIATRFAPLIEFLLVVVGVRAVIAAILHNGGFVRRLGRRSNDKGAT